MRVDFLEPARDEFTEAVEYYNSKKPGLGVEFATECLPACGRVHSTRNSSLLLRRINNLREVSGEVHRSIERILQYPEAWSPLSPNTRRCRKNKFPYGVVYQLRGDVLLVVAVMHLHRQPERWRARSK
jgi:hypothetical protein